MSKQWENRFRPADGAYATSRSHSASTSSGARSIRSISTASSSSRPRRGTTLEEYLEARNDFDRWKKTAHAVLKITEDWIAFQAWRPTQRRKSYANRTPFENAVVTAWAKGRRVSPSEQTRAACQYRRPCADESRSGGPAHGNGGAGRHHRRPENGRTPRDDPTGTVSILHPKMNCCLKSFSITRRRRPSKACSKTTCAQASKIKTGTSDFQKKPLKKWVIVFSSEATTCRTY